MRILWIYLENFKCYSKVRIPEEGILPSGLLRIEGLNSSGKSTLFDAIYYALFYDPAKDKYLAAKKEDLIRHGMGETTVQLAFEVDGKCFLVQRNHGKKLAVQAQLVELESSLALKGESKSIKLICSGTVEVNKKISELLNINASKAVKTLIVRQGEIEQLAEARGAQLRDLIYNLFDLEYYTERTNEVIKRRYEILEEELEKNRIDITTEAAQEIIKDHKQRLKEIEQNEIEYKKAIAELDKKLNEYPKIDDIIRISSILTAIKTGINNLNRDEQRLLNDAKRLNVVYPITEESIKKAIEKAKKEEEEIEEKMKKASKDQEEVISDISKTKNELAKLKKRKESLEKVSSEKEGKAICEVCEQEIAGDYLISLINRTNKAIPELKKKLEELEKRKIDINKLMSELEREKRSNQSKVLSIKNLSKQFQILEEQRNRIKTKEKELKEALKKFKVETPEKLAEKYGVKRFDELHEIIQDLQNKKSSLIAKINEQMKRKRDAEKEIKRYQAIIEENKIKEAKQEQIKQKMDLLKQVQEYVKSFIADDLITNRLLPGIQDATSNYIESFTMGRYTEIYLEPTKQKTLVMTIRDNEMDYIKSQQLLSGGDRAAIGLAMRIGISSLLKRIRPMKNSPYTPPKMDILILDEPLGSLDADRRENVLEGLLNEKRFSQIFLITHTAISPRIKPPTLRVHFSSTGSTITYIPPPTETEAEAEG